MRSILQVWLLLIVGFFLAGCAPQADYDIRGEWEYTMTATDGNLYDTGAITFSGEAARGTYLQVNIYAVEYEGEFTVDGVQLTLTGDESWQGTLADANTISGTWDHADENQAGTFSATRK